MKTLYNGRSFSATLNVPGDKSLSHRALLLSALAQGTSEISGLSSGDDVQSTMQCLRQLGTEIQPGNHVTKIIGRNFRFLPPRHPLDCGNSGTTARLLLGALAAQDFSVSLIGDASLSKRPMQRVTDPLKKFGATFEQLTVQTLPLKMHGHQELRPNLFDLDVASAQVKSAVLLAGLQAKGKSTITGKIHSRDHTERLLRFYGAELSCDEDKIEITGPQFLSARNWEIAGDPSSAAFWIAAAAIVPGSKIKINNCLLNPTRTGFFRVLRNMGMSIEEKVQTEVPEPTGQVIGEHRTLHNLSISEAEIPFVIDEIPLLAAIAPFCKGTMRIRGAKELRTKESDRLNAISENLRRMQVQHTLYEDGIDIEGSQNPRGANFDSFEDHRIAMAFSIAALSAEGPSQMLNSECVKVSYPNFFETLRNLQDL